MLFGAKTAWATKRHAAISAPPAALRGAGVAERALALWRCRARARLTSLHAAPRDRYAQTLIALRRAIGHGDVGDGDVGNGGVGGGGIGNRSIWSGDIRS